MKSFAIGRPTSARRSGLGPERVEIDVVIDPVGGATMAASLECLRPRGTVVNLGLSGGTEATIPHLYPFFRNERRIVGSWMGSMAELDFGLGLVKQGKISLGASQDSASGSGPQGPSHDGAWRGCRKTRAPALGGLRTQRS